MFLWCIINRSTANTNATISTIVRKITHLREVVVEKDSNVTAFNTNVSQLCNSYYANKREQVDSETLLYNLFEAYLICMDQDFVTYIRRQKQEFYIDATIPITSDILIERALKQYQTQVEEKTWGVESTDCKDIMSLNARMDKQEDVTNQKVTNQKNDDEVKATTKCHWK
jgi:hypothetical protein